MEEPDSPVELGSHSLAVLREFLSEKGVDAESDEAVKAALAEIFGWDMSEQGDGDEEDEDEVESSVRYREEIYTRVVNADPQHLTLTLLADHHSLWVCVQHRLWSRRSHKRVYATVTAGRACVERQPSDRRHVPVKDRFR
jgi:hypothetical protein